MEVRKIRKNRGQKRRVFARTADRREGYSQSPMIKACLFFRILLQYLMMMLMMMAVAIIVGRLRSAMSTIVDFLLYYLVLDLASRR